MNKIPIKIIKRKDTESVTNAKIKGLLSGEQLPETTFSEATIARRARREIVEAVSKWIPERRENKRAEEIAAVRKFFGSDASLSEI